MNAHAGNVEISCARRLGVKRPGIAEGHAKLMFAQAGRDVRMGVGRNIRVHPQRNRGSGAESGGTFRQRPQFRFALYVEEQNASLQRSRQCLEWCASGRENSFPGRSTVRCQHAFQFAAGDHVKAAALFCQQAQDAQVRVSFYGIADGVRYLAKRSVECVVSLLDHRGRIDIKGRPVSLDKCGQRDLIAMQHDIPAEQNASAAIDECGRAHRCRFSIAACHFRLGAAAAPLLTRIATTVWSSNVSTPAECSATALKRESTTQSAERSVHSETVCSTRPRPNNSPFRLRASRIPSLKKTNMSPGFIRNSNSS